MKKGSWFFDEKGFRYRCEEVLSPNLFVASENGHGNYAFIQKENGRFSRVVPKFTPDNVVVGSMVTGAFRNARWNVLGIEGEKVRGEVDFFTPDNRVVRKEFSDLDFSIFLEMLNSVFIVIPTKEDLPCNCKFISPKKAPNWKFRIIEEYGDDIVLVEIFYKKEKIDTRKVPRSLIAKWMNTPFEFGEPEMKGKDKMTTDDKFPAHSDVIKRLIDCRKEIEDIVKNCKNPLDRLLDNDIPWGKQVEALTPNLPKGCSLKAKIVKTGFVEDSKDGLHKD